MKKLLLFFFLLPFITQAQLNYFVNDGNLTVMRPTPADGYVGTNPENGSLVCLNHNFELIWAIGEFKGDVMDMVINQETGLITVIHKNYDACEVSEITSEGTVVTRQTFHIEGNLKDANIELKEDGYVFAFNAIAEEGDEKTSAILGVTNSDIEFEWLKRFEAPENYSFKAIDLEIYGDSIAFLATSLWLDIIGGYIEYNHSNLSRFTMDGTFKGATLLGTECSHYVDIEHLPGEGFVVVGEVERDETEALKVSVLDYSGTVLATKQKRTSGSDSGWNRATVEVLSDGRYVVCNNYYEGHGAYNQGAIIFFDNHKPVQRWEYRPAPWVGEDSDDLFLWCVDNNDQLIITGDVYDVEYGVEVVRNMGRMTWLSEDCGIGNYYGATLNYGIDPTEIIELTISDVTPVDYSDGLDPLVAFEYSNTFDCSHESFDEGPVVEDNHLYGGEITECQTIGDYDDPGDDDDDPDDDPDEEYEEEVGDGDGIDGGGYGDVDDLSLAENNHSFTIYPNPTAGTIFIKGEGITEIMIYNAQGQLVETRIPLSDLIEIELEATGVYIFRLMNQFGEFTHQKVVKH